MKPLSSLFSLWLLQLGVSQAVVYVDGSSNTWNPMIGNYDFHVDQQTGLGNPSSSDIVGGTGTNYGFLVAFNNNGNVSSIDGNIGFRVRLDTAGGNSNNPSYTSVVWIGIDANTDGKLDVMLGANFQGSNSQLEIRAPGAGANVSPSTTTISNATYKTYAIDNIEDATPANFSYRAVNFLTDGGDTNDVTQNTTGDPDYYLSFMVPFADIVTYLGTLSTPINIIDTTPLRFVVATSTQVNSLNQDIGGLNGGVSSDIRWDAPGGGLSTPYTPVPEPSSSVLLLGALAGGCFVRRRR
jgi:hypothetical protein